MFARPGTTWTFDSSDNVDLAQAEQHLHLVGSADLHGPVETLYVVNSMAVMGRITMLCSLIGFFLNAIALVRLKSSKTPKTPFVIILAQLTFIDMIFSCIPSAFLARAFYDSHYVDKLPRTEREILLNLAGFLWCLKQFVTYYFILFLAALGCFSMVPWLRCIKMNKKSTYIVSGMIWIVVMVNVLLPLVGGQLYIHAHEQSLIQFNGTFTLLGLSSNVFEWTYSILPFVVFLVLSICAGVQIGMICVKNLKRFWKGRDTDYVAVPHQRPLKDSEMTILYYIMNFLVWFGLWIALLGLGEIELFAWRISADSEHEDEIPAYLAFMAGGLFLSIQCCISPLIYLKH